MMSYSFKLGFEDLELRAAEFRAYHRVQNPLRLDKKYVLQLFKENNY